MLTPSAHAGGTCLRAPLCMHCANAALQLEKPPGQRFLSAHPPGSVVCLICRETRVDARMLAPETAYAVNHVLMDAMDLLQLPGSCR